MPRKNEANVISYSVLIDPKGKITTEQSIADISEIESRLHPITYSTLQTITRVAKEEFKKIHNKLELELDAKVYKDV
jgi:hypothetical protein|tara:strand:+ start:947 stop:1177 length:231 start_codon:yes stop_codon:yes gene_type:complete